MKKTPFRIVRMGLSHARTCAALCAASEPWKTLGEGIDFPRSIRKKQSFVCLLGRDLAGFVVFTPEPVFARGGYLRAIAVADAHRNRGVGRMLMEFAERRTARRADNLFLCVSSFNRKGQAFYRSLGYIRVGKVPGLIMPGASELIFWKRLRSAAP